MPDASLTSSRLRLEGTRIEANMAEPLITEAEPDAPDCLFGLCDPGSFIPTIFRSPDKSGPASITGQSTLNGMKRPS